MADYDRVVVVKKKTDYEMLSLRYSSDALAETALSSRNDNIERYAVASLNYASNLRKTVKNIPKIMGLNTDEIDYLNAPLYAWGPRQIVVLVGPEGLFANVAKYLKHDQPVICINPDPTKVDGIIMRHQPHEMGNLVRRLVEDKAGISKITLGRVRIGKQELLAVNDFLVGRADQRASYYTLTYAGQAERQGSSGVIVAAPVGLTGWIKSCMKERTPKPRTWAEDQLVFWVREPFVQKGTSDDIVTGFVGPRFNTLSIQSEMPEGGVIFSDGVPDDGLEFTTGSEAVFDIADRKISYVWD